MKDTFEPRVFYWIQKKQDSVVLKTGFYVHFKKNTWFKSIVEKNAAE
jgi:hypothetical protein